MVQYIVLLQAKRSKGDEGILAYRRETPSTCLDGNRRQCIKSLKMDKNQYSYFHVLKLCSASQCHAFASYLHFAMDTENKQWNELYSRNLFIEQI